MNKKHTLLCISLMITYLCTYGMEQEQLTYEKFKLTRPGGTLKFDCLTQDIVEKHIKPHLAEAIAIKFKHRILNYKYQEKNDRNNNEIQQLTYLNVPINTIFSHHDGTYTIVPDIKCSYAMWDESNINRAFTTITTINDLSNEYVSLLYKADQEDSNTGLYFPSTECLKDNKKTAYIKSHGQNIQRSFPSRLKHHVLSHDAVWLALSTSSQCNSLVFFNLNSLKLEEALPLESPITALCAAHHSPLFITGCENGNIIFTMPKTTKILLSTKDATIGVQFSPDDKRFISYGKNTLTLWSKDNENPTSRLFSYCEATCESAIRKASFSPDGTLIIIAHEDGSLGFCNGLTCKPLIYYLSTWRRNDVSTIDNQAPLILYSTKNKLLFSLDPAHHTDSTIATFIVRKASGKFDFLTTYNFFPDNPKAMGLTEDERSVIFMHNDDTVSQLNLYDNQDTEDINFIEQKANLYQLCELFQICKKFKTNQENMINTNATAFINAMRACIVHYQKDYLNS